MSRPVYSNRRLQSIAAMIPCDCTETPDVLRHRYTLMAIPMLGQKCFCPCSWFSLPHSPFGFVKLAVIQSVSYSVIWNLQRWRTRLIYGILDFCDLCKLDATLCARLSVLSALFFNSLRLVLWHMFGPATKLFISLIPLQHRLCLRLPEVVQFKYPLPIPSLLTTV